LVGLLYPVYGLIVAPSLYLQIILSQSNRGFSAALNLLEQVVQPTFKNWFTDGWWTGGWLISFVYLFRLRKKKKAKLLIFSFISLILVTLLMSSANYPWYFISATPFLSMFVGVFLCDLWVSPRFEKILLFFIFLFSSSFYWGFNVLNQESTRVGFVYKMFLLVLIIASLGNSRFRRFRWWKWGWYIFFALVLHRLFLWNFRSITYLVANWGSWVK
jgi:membrane-associated HD superfamily phosphohydrolase